MQPLEVAIIGAGPSGLLAADKLLGTVAFETNIHLFEKYRNIGGIPKDYRTVPPNSPFHDLYSFFMDLQTEQLFSPDAQKKAQKILKKAQQEPTLGCLADALQLFWDDLLSKESASRLDYQYGCEITKIIENHDGSYDVEILENIFDTSRITVDVVISAIGAQPKKNPYKNICSSEIDLNTALDKSKPVFKDKKIIIAGSSHSAAIAFINAVNQKAKEIEVWYQHESFREHRIDQDKIKHYQFTGINEPTLSALKSAMKKYSGKYQCLPLTLPDNTQNPQIFQKKNYYHDWSIVSAVGFESSPLPFITKEGKEGLVTTIKQSQQFGDSPPNLCYPQTTTAIPRVYGLGLAYPLPFTQGFLPNTQETPGAKIVGIYFTNELTKILVPDIMQNLPEYLMEDNEE